MSFEKTFKNLEEVIEKLTHTEVITLKILYIYQTFI